MANATTNQLGAAEASIRGTLPHPHWARATHTSQRPPPGAAATASK
jgi:hypothetical protein